MTSWIAFAAGLFLGVFIGIFLAGLCIVASQGESDYEALALAQTDPLDNPEPQPAKHKPAHLSIAEDRTP